MSELNPKDWTLVFNLTGIDQKPGEHFFGLYNSYTGVLRVFYYLTEDRIPASDSNDHMWTMGLSKDLLEHVIFQFAIPYEEEATESYKNALGGNDALFQTTALTAVLGIALGAIGKGLESGLKKASKDPDKLGEFTGRSTSR